jgi:GNAT superfamily N-acetyltransferase
MYETREITDANEKTRICDAILRALPDWFGDEESIVNYTRQVQAMPFFVVLDKNCPAGFVSIKPHNAHTAEIYVMGVRGEYHRRGIGKMIIKCCENYCRENKMDFLTVKTLDASRHWPPYEITRHFYLSAGFRPLEVFPLLWDESNPCLFMAKYVGNTA